MGLTYTQFQIYNKIGKNKEEIKELFIKLMKQEGWETTVLSDRHKIAYKIVFSKTTPWVSIVCTDALPRTMESDVKKLARIMESYCTLTVVSDSDELVLFLYNEKGVQKDIVGIGYEIFEMFPNQDISGNPEAWQPVMVEGGSMEKLKTTFTKERQTFVEDNLWDIAEVLGMDKINAVSPWAAFESEAKAPRQMDIKSNNPYVIDLYFKKNSAQSNKKISSHSKRTNNVQPNRKNSKPSSHLKLVKKVKSEEI